MAAPRLPATTIPRRASLWHAARGAVLTTLGYDNASRLTSIGDDLAGTGADITSSFAYSPAKQLTSFGRTNDSYAYAAYVADAKDATRSTD